MSIIRGMDIRIRHAKPEDADAFRKMCQRVYEKTYANSDLGIGGELFSEEVFDSEDTRRYFGEMLAENELSTSLVAETPQGKIVGGISVRKNHDHTEVRGFYVHIEHQGQGIGKLLWDQAESIIGQQTVVVEVYWHAFRAVNYYIGKGFRINTKKPYRKSSWPEWPKGTELVLLNLIRSTERPKRTGDGTAAYKLYCDGGSRGNPGPSAGGYVLFDDNDRVVYENGKYLGITTNNQAEYHSLKGGLEKSIELGVANLDVYMDSLLVVNQMKGIFKIRNRDLWPIHDAITKLLPRFKNVSFHHVPRELNKEADRLVNETLDNQA